MFEWERGHLAMNNIGGFGVLVIDMGHMDIPDKSSLDIGGFVVLVIDMDIPSKSILDICFGPSSQDSVLLFACDSLC